MNNYANGSTSGQAACQEDLPLTKSRNGYSTSWERGIGTGQPQRQSLTAAATTAAAFAGHSYKLQVCTICQALKPHGRPTQANKQLQLTKI